MDQREIADRLGSLIDELRTLHRFIVEGAGKLPAEAEQRLRDRECLNCGQKFKAGERVVRGNHESCWRLTNEAIKAGRMTDDEAVAAGFFAPKSKGGRPVTDKGAKLDAYLRSKEDPDLALRVAEGHADIDRAIARDEAEQAGMAPKRQRRKAN